MPMRLIGDAHDTLRRTRPATPLPGGEFRARMRLEMRRADRAGTPLSLVVLRGDSLHNKDLLVWRQNLLCDASRETDVVGILDEARLAVLLPDTSTEGRDRFTQKIAQIMSHAGSPMVAESGTYPDQLFDALRQDQTSTSEADDARVEEMNSSAPCPYALKRALDVVGAVVALVLLSPLMAITALAIACTSPGPVIFRQVRIGQGGRPFVFYKFRSMRRDVDDATHRSYVANLIKGQSASASDTAKGASYKMSSDPRVTRVGRWIRKTSIDELPQFYNVLRGDMSLVGPRPPLPYEVEHYKAWHLRRVLQLKPGLTGPWQVEGRSRVPFDEMVRMDLRYLDTCSLWTDVKLLLRTVVVVLRCEGAA